MQLECGKRLPNLFALIIIASLAKTFVFAANSGESVGMPLSKSPAPLVGVLNVSDGNSILVNGNFAVDGMTIFSGVELKNREKPLLMLSSVK